MIQPITSQNFMQLRNRKIKFKRSHTNLRQTKQRTISFKHVY